jgi:hypothetical protein
VFTREENSHRGKRHNRVFYAHGCVSLLLVHSSARRSALKESADDKVNVCEAPDSMSEDSTTAPNQIDFRSDSAESKTRSHSPGLILWDRKELEKVVSP